MHGPASLGGVRKRSGCVRDYRGNRKSTFVTVTVATFDVSATLNSREAGGGLGGADGNRGAAGTSSSSAADGNNGFPHTVGNDGTFTGSDGSGGSGNGR